MCEFEKNILLLLNDEKKHLDTLLLDKGLPYRKSLEHGIKSAEKKLKECEYKECVKKFHYKYGQDLVPTYALPRWNTLYDAFINCKKD
jgi:hypothetical protein